MSAPRRRSDLTSEEIEETGELIVIDLATQKATVLNPTAAEVWLRSDGVRDAATIGREIAELVGEGAPPPARLTADVEECLRTLLAEGLLEN